MGGKSSRSMQIDDRRQRLGTETRKKNCKTQQRPADLVPAKPDVMGSYGGFTRLSRMEHETGCRCVAASCMSMRRGQAAVTRQMGTPSCNTRTFQDFCDG